MKSNGIKASWADRIECYCETHVKKLRVISNVSLTNRLPEKVDSIKTYSFDKRNRWCHLLSVLKLLNSLPKYDAMVAFNADVDAMFIAFVNRKIFRRRTVVVFYDLNLHAPNNYKEQLFCMVKSFLLSGVDALFCMHKDMSSYRRHYKLDEKMCGYIPFKANNFESLPKYRSVDGGYVLSCGASYRDFDTLVCAMKTLPYPCKIMLPPPSVAKVHNTYLDEQGLPENVEVMRHNFDAESWNQHIAAARLVVIPLLKKALQPAGISVYLEAMALGKPVIISEGASTRGILTDQEAEIVPAEDPAALALAIQKVWEDTAYREQLARNGQRYALSLGGEERLVRDILSGICAVVEAKRAEKRGEI